MPLSHSIMKYPNYSCMSICFTRLNILLILISRHEKSSIFVYWQANPNPKQHTTHKRSKRKNKCLQTTLLQATISGEQKDKLKPIDLVPLQYSIDRLRINFKGSWYS